MTHLRDLLLPELEAELANTRRMLSSVPDGQGEFRSAPKSMTLSRLAGHVAEMPSFITMVLTSPDLDLSKPGGPKAYKHETTAQALAAFDEWADHLITLFKQISDETFQQHWSVAFGEHKIYSGSRYGAYRSIGVNHMVHHRAQLGVYLRLLEIPVPKTYGPSADEM